MQNRIVSVANMWDRISRALLLAAGACFWGAVAVTVSDVILRFVFSVTLPATIEISTLFVAAGVMFSLPECFAARGHIQVTLLTDLLSARWQTVARTFGALMSLLFMVFIFLIFARHAADYAGSMRRLPDTGLNYFSVISCVTIGFGLSMVGALRGLRRKSGKDD